MYTKQAGNVQSDNTSSPKNPHEIDNDFTLPNGEIQPEFCRSVMWHGPNPIGLGGRSPVPKDEVPARGVTDGVQTPVGAALAGTAVVHPAQTGGCISTEMAVTQTHENGDVTETISYQTTNSMDWAAWRQRVMLARHQGVSTKAPDADASTLTEKQAFEIVKLGRDCIRLNNAHRKARQDTPASSKTLADYAKKCKQIDCEMEELADESDPLRQVMGRHAARKQSFTAIKSALKSREIKNIQDVLRSQDALQRVSSKGAIWKKHVLHLLATMQDFIEVDTLDRCECLEQSGHKARVGRSKRSDLPHLMDGWQERFLAINALDSAYSDAGVLLRHCGLRPIELFKGVTVTATPDGILVHILGGKVRKMAGQPWRSFLLNPTLLPDAFVQRLQIAGEIIVTAMPDALRMHLNRLSDFVFQQGEYKLKGKKNRQYVLSAYTFRHAFVTDLRSAGWEKNDIAAALGESSAQTVALYGIRRHTGSKILKTVAGVKNSVKAERSVRPVSKIGLAKIQAGREKSRLYPRQGQ
jgi:integrase